MIRIEDDYNLNHVSTHIDPNAWLTPPHFAVDLFAIESAAISTQKALETLSHNLRHPIRPGGVYLDVCSGNGIAVMQFLWPRGCEVVHVDRVDAETMPILSGRLAYFFIDDDWSRESTTIACQRADQYIKNNFVRVEVGALALDPEELFEKASRAGFDGGFLLHPPGDKLTIQSAIDVAARTLINGAPLFVLTDKSDHGDLAFIREALTDRFSVVDSFDNIDPDVTAFIAYL